MYGVHSVTNAVPEDEFILFSGNTDYVLVLLPTALKIRDPWDSNKKYPWPSTLTARVPRGQVSGIYGTGEYDAYIFNISTETLEINGIEYTYSNGLYNTIYYDD